jgi:hypothetical protein
MWVVGMLVGEGRCKFALVLAGIYGGQAKHGC